MSKTVKDEQRLNINRRGGNPNLTGDTDIMHSNFKDMIENYFNNNGINYILKLLEKDYSSAIAKLVLESDEFRTIDSDKNFENRIRVLEAGISGFNEHKTNFPKLVVDVLKTQLKTIDEVKNSLSSFVTKDLLNNFFEDNKFFKLSDFISERIKFNKHIDQLRNELKEVKASAEKAQDDNYLTKEILEKVENYGKLSANSAILEENKEKLEKAEKEIDDLKQKFINSSTQNSLNGKEIKRLLSEKANLELEKEEINSKLNLLQTENSNLSQKCENAESRAYNAELKQQSAEKIAEKKSEEAVEADKRAESAEQQAEIANKQRQDAISEKETAEKIAKLAENEKNIANENLQKAEIAKNQAEKEKLEALKNLENTQKELEKEKTVVSSLQEKLNSLKNQNSDLTLKASSISNLKVAEELLEYIRKDDTIAPNWIDKDNNDGNLLMRIIARASQWNHIVSIMGVLNSRCKERDAGISNDELKFLEGCLYLYNLTLDGSEAILVDAEIDSDFDPEDHERASVSGEKIISQWLPGLQNPGGILIKKPLVITK